ncbi:MAG: diaminopimelate decarboxylase, partial [Niameybacter sp.]
MHTLHGNFTNQTNFFGGNNIFDLVQEYGSPLYIYNEGILRTRCKEIKNLVTYENFIPHYSVKANTNIHLLKIIREEGLHADVMSPGEIYLALKSGFQPEELFFIPNNVTSEDMRYAIDHGILMSLDSLSQLELYGTLNPGGKVAIRFNPGIGAGHHEKVVTAGKKTKFGVNPED